jgi:hypothetical protein
MGRSLLEIITTKETSYGIDPHHRSGVVVWRQRLLGASARSFVGGCHCGRWGDVAEFRSAAVTLFLGGSLKSQQSRQIFFSFAAVRASSAIKGSLYSLGGASTWLRSFSILEVETLRRNRQGVGPCFRSRGNSVLLRERLVGMHQGRLSGEDPLHAWLFRQSLCSTSRNYSCFRPERDARQSMLEAHPIRIAAFCVLRYLL